MSGWYNNGNDRYGFSGLPGGNLGPDLSGGGYGNTYTNIELNSYWRSSTEYNNNTSVYYWHLGFNSNSLNGFGGFGKNFAMSVRCIKD